MKSICHSLVIMNIPKASCRNVTFKLSSEIMDATKGSGDAILREEETHAMAEAKAFARHLSSYASFKLHKLGLTI